MAMVVGAPVFPINQLVAARAVAAVVGTAGILATYALGRGIFGHWAGLLAAGALALCPIHVGWSRCAVTPGDVFVTTFFTLGLWLMFLSLRHGSGRAMMGCAVAIGLAFGAKISAVLLWPTCVLYAALLWAQRTPIGDESHTDQARRRLTWATLLHAGLLPPLGLVFFWPAAFGQTHPQLRFWLWLAGLAVYVAGFLWLVRSSWSLSGRHIGWIVVNICLGGAITAAFATPYHLRMEIIDGLVRWWREFGGRRGAEPIHVLDVLSMIQILMIYTKVPINLLAVGVLIAACRRRNWDWGGLVVITLTITIATLTILHHKAAYYLMPVLPLLHVLAGGGAMYLLRALSARGHVGLAVSGTALAFLVALHGHRIVALHPHYLLDGFDWETRLIFTPKLRPANMQFQAARPAVEWLSQHAAPGAQVAVLFPDYRPVLGGLSIAVLAFEVQRSPQAQARGLRFGNPQDPKQLERWRYVISYLPMHSEARPTLPGFERIHEVRVHDVPAAWILGRQPTQP
jgi:hypothetical protein